MLKRKLFFLLERLNITPGERRFIVLIVTFVAVISLINLFLSPRQKYDKAYYAPLRKEYRKKLAAARRRDSIRKITYYKTGAIKNKHTKKSFHQGEAFHNVKKIAQKKSKKSQPNELISINSSGLEALQSLRGIGPKTAQKIIDYRTKHGPFKKLKSLTLVKGIGKKKFEKLKMHITL
ncbi:MAG TPA: ComEA family DNA-binding protein [Balneolales bacterium]|nr:ComEA family DNA-binding protein [Balneolales bacterium]